jgi:hypothetical protein
MSVKHEYLCGVCSAIKSLQHNVSETYIYQPKCCENLMELKARNEKAVVRVVYENDKPINFGSRPPQITPRFSEYKSQIDGSMITDRGQHREHLKANGATEIGTAYDSQVKAIKEAASYGKEREFKFHEESKTSCGFKEALYRRFNQ